MYGGSQVTVFIQFTPHFFSRHHTSFQKTCGVSFWGKVWCELHHTFPPIHTGNDV